MTATAMPHHRRDPDAAALRIRDLTVEFSSPDGVVHAVTDVSYEVRPGEVLGVVGESGSGKTVTVLAALGLLPSPPAHVRAGEVLLSGRDLLRLPERELRTIRGRDIGFVFQDPMTSFDPVKTIGAHLREALVVHDTKLSRRDVRERCLTLLDKVGIPEPARRLRQYPHEFSGGMRQRVMVAIAIANNPRVLVADEPTTALDVTVQAQLLEVLQAAQRETGAATVLITHDLGVLAEVADRIVVMYAGRVVEVGPITDIFHRPRHPYTEALVASVPRIEDDSERLATIPGQPPNLLASWNGCPFHPRCGRSGDRAPCRETVPSSHQVGDGHEAACHFVDEWSGGSVPQSEWESRP